jgi:UDP-3-O-[3-hydroxymyristoyl] glucosamine N-acyltransferase LpxD
VLKARLHENEIRRVIGIDGEGSRVIDGLAPLDAGEDRCLYFITKKINESIRQALAQCHGCVVIAPTGLALSGELGDSVVLESPESRAAIAKVLRFIRDEQRQQPWLSERKVAPNAVISPLAFIDQQIEIGADVVIEPFCYIESDVRIGRGSTIRSGARLYSRVSIGDESVIGANTVVGHQGYGFVRDESGNKTRIPHLGGVVIGSHVEIGALSTVQSGTIGPTIIEDYAKIDDHVHVGHNVRIARSASVTGGVMIGGTAVIGEEAWVGINASIRNGRKVGHRSLVGMDVSVQEDLDNQSVARAPRPDVRPRSDDDDSTIGFA